MGEDRSGRRLEDGVIPLSQSPYANKTSLGTAPGLVLLMSIMLIVKVKGVCYNHFVGRRVLPMVASRFCYRRREGYAMTPYEIIMERILSIENPVLFRSIIEVNAYRVLNWRGRINSIYSYFCSALVFFRASFSSCHLFSLLFDVSLEVYTEFWTVSGNAGRTERKRAGYI